MICHCVVPEPHPGRPSGVVICMGCGLPIPMAPEPKGDRP